MNARASNATAAQAALAKVIKALGPVVSKDATRYSLARVCVKGKTLAATNGSILVEVTLPEQEILSDGLFDPKTTAALLMAGGTPAPAEDGFQFPDYKQVIPKDTQGVGGEPPAFDAALLSTLMDATDKIGRAVHGTTVQCEVILGDPLCPTKIVHKLGGLEIVGVIMPMRK